MKSISELSNKFLLTFTEASQLFGIGENKLRSMASQDGDNIPKWIIYNGKRALIKRERLEELLNDSISI